MKSTPHLCAITEQKGKHYAEDRCPLSQPTRIVCMPLMKSTSRFCAIAEQGKARPCALYQPAHMVRTFYNSTPCFCAVITEQGEALRSMIAALSRPTRIVRGKAVDPSWSVDPAKFEHPEEVGVQAQLLRGCAPEVIPACSLPGTGGSDCACLQLWGAIKTWDGRRWVLRTSAAYGV
eukprot:scaffold112168_cov35-Tisochrysis_lutea.AAC.1